MPYFLNTLKLKQSCITNDKQTKNNKRILKRAKRIFLFITFIKMDHNHKNSLQIKRKYKLERFSYHRIYKKYVFTTAS